MTYIQTRGAHGIKVRVYVGKRLATTFWSTSDHDTTVKIPDLLRRYTKRKRRANATTRKDPDRDRITAIVFNYVDDPPHHVPSRHKVKARKEPVCPVARP